MELLKEHLMLAMFLGALAVGFYYLGIAGTDLIAIMILVLFNAETIYAVYKRLTDIAEGKVEAGE